MKHTEACRLSALNMGEYIEVLDEQSNVVFAGELVSLMASKPFSERIGQTVCLSVRNGKLSMTQTIPGDTIIGLGGAA